MSTTRLSATLGVIVGTLLLAGCGLSRGQPVERPVSPGDVVCRDQHSGAELSLAEALEIGAAGDCVAEGEMGESRVCNQNTGTWWIDLDIDEPGCNPACVVDVNSRAAEINWRCTGLVPPEEADSSSDGSDEEPTVAVVEVPDPARARDTALDYVGAAYGEQAPPPDLVWAQETLTDEDVVGASTERYTAGDWVVTIAFPVAAPENVVCQITITNPTTGFGWVGEVGAAGQVTEQLTDEPYAFRLPEGWLTYVNNTYEYVFAYPPSATVAEAGVRAFPTEEPPEGKTMEEYVDQLRATLGDNLCVSIGYELGYVSISGPPNKGFRYTTCGRTGVGAGELVVESEPVVIAGEVYTATGYQFLGAAEPCEALSCHNQTMVIHLPDGTRIEYGAVPDETATYDDYVATTRDVLLQIVASYTPFDE